MKRFSIFAAAAFLVADAPAFAQPDPVVTAAQGYELRLLGGGLAAGRRGLHSYPVFVFGISRTEALSRVTALRGRASATGIGRNCGRVPLNFARFGTLTLWFRSNRWVGWSLTGPRGRRPIETEFDLGIGTERRQIGDADSDRPVFRRTRRGVEFEADGMQGLLNGPGPRARVTVLWSGDTCRPG
jgi:hypothetical protein